MNKTIYLTITFVFRVRITYVVLLFLIVLQFWFVTLKKKTVLKRHEISVLCITDSLFLIKFCGSESTLTFKGKIDYLSSVTELHQTHGNYK